MRERCRTARSAPAVGWLVNGDLGDVMTGGKQGTTGGPLVHLLEIVAEG